MAGRGRDKKPVFSWSSRANDIATGPTIASNRLSSVGGVAINRATSCAASIPIGYPSPLRLRGRAISCHIPTSGSDSNWRSRGWPGSSAAAALVSGAAEVRVKADPSALWRSSMEALGLVEDVLLKDPAGHAGSGDRCEVDTVFHGEFAHQRRYVCLAVRRGDRARIEGACCPDAAPHRLASVRNCDQIYLLHEESIVERGTHEALLARDKPVVTSVIIPR